jgi:hypothetical protein
MYNFAGLILIVFVEVDRFDEWIEDGRMYLETSRWVQTTRTAYFLKLKTQRLV